MNSVELFHKDGKPAGVFYCGECRIVHRTQEHAEQCCAPYKCERCGEIVQEKYWTICTACRKRKEEERERERFENAEKVKADDYDGVLYVEGMSGDYGDGYFSGLETLLDYCGDEDSDPPEYAWVCKPCHFASLDIDRVLSYIGDGGDAYEDFDYDDLVGVKDLEKAIDAFNEANKGIVSYQPDYTKAVLLPRTDPTALQERAAWERDAKEAP